EQERKSLGADANRDVSVGFTFKQDSTPGIWRGQPYDYVQRDIFLQHVAGAISKGRCAFPFCGLGADESASDLWEVTPQYIRSGHRRSEDFDKDSFRTVQLTPGIKAIIACPQGAYIQGKCNTGTQIQSFLFDREKFSLKEAQAWFSKHEHDSFDYDSQEGGDKEKMGNKLENGIIRVTADDGDVKDARTGEKAVYWVPLSEASTEAFLEMKDYVLTDADKALSIEDIQKRIDALYAQRDKIQKESNESLAPQKVPDTTREMWRKIEDIDAEIRAFKDLKAKMIVNGQIDSSCPICKEINRLGPIEFAKRLGATFSLDSILKAVSDSPTPLQPKPTEEKKTAPPSETKTDNIDQVERSKKLIPERLYGR
ncbi:MAG: hypothetical protein QG670_749, partial [Thermoproteota archaeon]|nr:hypothetical protein [Thermoproteota archaeon]